MEDIYTEEIEEKHSFDPIRQSENTDKPFRIERCSKCGKFPTVIKHSEIEGKGRYEIKCCKNRILEKTETACIYEWNADQRMEDDGK